MNNTLQDPKVEIVRKMKQKGEEFCINYIKFDLSSDPEMLREYKRIKALIERCRLFLENEAKRYVSADEIGSLPVSENAKTKRKSEKLKEQEKKNVFKETAKDIKKLKKEIRKAAKDENKSLEKLEDALEQYKDLAISFMDSGISGILNGKEKLDKGFLKPAQEFISKANAFLSIASFFADTELSDKIDKVKSWVETAQKVIEKINSIDKYLKGWRDIAVAWMESGISEVVSGANVVGNISNILVSNASDFKNTVKNFIEEVKQFADASLDEKLAKAEEWLSKADTLLDQAGDVAENIFKDADKNGLPDWFDLLSREWDKFSVKDLIPGKLDEAIISKLNEFKAKVEEWLRKASAEMGPSIKDKIEKAKIWVADIQRLIDLTQQGKEFIEDLKNNDIDAILDKLKSLYEVLPSLDSILEGTDIDDKLLAELKKWRAKAENFASIANSLIKKLPGRENLGTVEDWIKKALEIATDMANGEDVVGNYLNLAKQWAEGEIKKVIDGVKEISAEVAGEVSGFVNEVKKFMAGASALKKGDFADKIAAAAEWIKSSESILDNAAVILDKVLGDVDGNNLPDWYDKLSKVWDDMLGGKDLIPGMDFDDALIGKLNVFKKEAEKWLSKAVELGEELQEKINNVRQWIDTGSKFLKEVAGFIEDIKEGDFLSAYEKFKEGWNALGDMNDLLEGTNIDNKIIDRVKEYKSQAEAILANALTGGKANGEITDDVRDILSLADNFLTFIFTKYKVEDHLQDFQEDKIVITDPQGRELSQEQINDLIGEFSGGLDGTLRNKIIAVINKINQEIISLGAGIDAAYRKTMSQGAGAANVYILAKSDYESVMKKQKQVEKLLKSLRKVLVSVITAALIPVNPAAAAVVGALLSGTLTDFSSLVGYLGQTASNSDGAVGQIGGIISAILPSSDGLSNIADAENQGLFNLTNLFNMGVTVKYEEVKSFVAKIQTELDKIFKTLYKLTEEGLENAKVSVAGAADKWKNLSGQIYDKYINTKNTRINENAAYWLLSRAQYASWLTTKKDTMIVDEVIDALIRFKILKEAGVKWNKGAGGDIAKALGWLLGGWASFGYDKKVKSLNKWAKEEVKRLEKTSSWQGVFG